MSVTAKEFITAIAEKMGWNTENEEFTEFISNEALAEINLPEKFQEKFDGNYMSFEQAKENIGIQKHFKGINLGYVDNMMKKVLKNDLFSDDDREAIEEAEGTKAKFNLLIDTMGTRITESSTNGVSDEKLKEANKELLKKVADLGKELESKESDFKTMIADMKTNHTAQMIKGDLVREISSQSLMEKIPGGRDNAINAIANTILGGKTENHDGFILGRKSDNTLGLFDKNDPDLPYTDENGKEVPLSIVLEKEVDPWVVKRSGTNHVNNNSNDGQSNSKPQQATGSLEAMQSKSATSKLDGLITDFNSQK